MKSVEDRIKMDAFGAWDLVGRPIIHKQCPTVWYRVINEIFHKINDPIYALVYDELE